MRRIAQSRISAFQAGLIAIVVILISALAFGVHNLMNRAKLRAKPSNVIEGPRCT